MDLEKNNKKGISIATHILVWLVLFSLPYVLSAGTDFNLERTLKCSTVPLIYYTIIFYINYFFLIDRFWFKNHKAYYIIGNLLMIVFFVYVNFNVRHFFFEAPSITSKRSPLRLHVYLDMVSMLIPILFSIGLRTYERWALSEDKHRLAINEKLISELQHLKYQLQPHFFFNSLNNIYSLIDRYPDKAKEVVHSLGKLMRYLLYETNAEHVSLSKEIDFMKKYIELMQLRTSDNTVIHASFPDPDKTIQVSPLLFISLIENAFKHGVSASQKSEITFNMVIDERQILFTTKNIHLPKDTTDRSGSGIGLVNLKKRLDLIYPGSYLLYSSVVDGVYVATLRIAYKKEEV
ncbi:sensor histidine kinase [Cytophaga aurantiaca]|uniref:sensor histidine kinase n=1 Tax=Cytophaga aurantiaca TaxID=29530 RepID=UPI00035CCA25|nr:histidine kinase [Cytophaga aurantiaca]